MKEISSSPETMVCLVDVNDKVVGVEEKLKAHQAGGQLHRAFSIFIIDEMDRVLLQRRASSKYHCPGLWANSCCSHPQPGKKLLECAENRLREEVGFSTPLQRIGAAQYRLSLSNGLTEWEFDHIFLGRYSGSVAPAPDEVDSVAWVDISVLAKEMTDHAERFVPWLSEIFPVFLKAMRKQAEWRRTPAVASVAGVESENICCNL